MALQVWLPLNGNIKNQGLNDVVINNVNGVSDSAGKIGKCYSFNGTNAYIKGTYSLSSTQSFACWVYFPNSVPTGQHLFDARSNDSVGYQPMYISSNAIQIGGVSGYVSASYSWAANKWYHICVTHNESVGSLYINGSLVLETSGAPGVTSTGNCTFTICSRHNQANYCSAKVNDVRIYDHCLSPKEIKEISKGLVLHYKMDDGCLKTSNNLVTGLTGGGQCTISNNTVAISGSNSDTYFYLNTSAALTSGKTYKISCVGHFDDGKYYYFPIGGQSNTSPGQLLVKNGYCSLVFTANSTIQNCGTQIIMDDTSRSAGAGTITNIMLEEVNGIWDCSGFGNNGVLVAGTMSLSSDSARYSYSTNMNSSAVIDVGTSAKVADCISVCWWGYMSNWANYGRAISVTESGGWNFEANGGKMSMALYTNGAYYNPVDSAALSSLSAGWHHWCGTYDRNTVKLYRDGNLVSTISINKNTDIGYNTNKMFIGAESAGSTYSSPYFDGKLSDVRIYATPLSAEDVKELYNTSAIICNNGTVMAYSLEE